MNAWTSVLVAFTDSDQTTGRSRPRPRVAVWEVTLSTRKVVTCVRWLATTVLLRTVYSHAQGYVRTALQLGGDVEQPWLMTSSIKPEVYNISPISRCHRGGSSHGHR